MKYNQEIPHYREVNQLYLPAAMSKRKRDTVTCSFFDTDEKFVCEYTIADVVVKRIKKGNFVSLKED